MTEYERLLQTAANEHVQVHESYDLNGDSDTENRIDGFYLDKHIALDKALSSETERSCVLAEEMGHYYTTVGDITDQTITSNRKQEYRARLWAYNDRIGLMGIVSACRHYCQSLQEMADYLNVPEKYLTEAIKCYHSKYGLCTEVDNYIIYFEPLSVARIF